MNVPNREKSNEENSKKLTNMSFYQKLANSLEKSPNKHKYLKFFFNISPMYRRSCGRLVEISKDMHRIKGKIIFSYKNMNYMGTMFGGSMLSATDPIYMVQLTQILGKEYVVWDKSVKAKFKRPIKKTVWVDYIFTEKEIDQIKKRVEKENEITFIKPIEIKDKEGNVYAELEKELYVSTQVFYKEKLRLRKINKK